MWVWYCTEYSPILLLASIAAMGGFNSEGWPNYMDIRFIGNTLPF